MNCKEEWQSFGSILFRPMTLIFLFLALAGLGSPLYVEEKHKAVIYILQTLASVFAGILGGLVADRYKEITGNTILSKKGISAVRGLALIRHKTRNIISRIKQVSNNPEIINLIELLEKDIANVSREWDDIIPGITSGIDTYYDTLTAKEFELEEALKENEQFQAKLSKEKESGQKANEELKKLEAEHRKKINELQKQISSLENKSVNIMSLGNTHSLRDLCQVSVARKKKCTRCRREYDTDITRVDFGLCPTCSSGDSLFISAGNITTIG